MPSTPVTCRTTRRSDANSLASHRVTWQPADMFRQLGGLLARRLPFVGTALRERDRVLKDNEQPGRLQSLETVRFVAPGHFYSPIPSPEDITWALSRVAVAGQTVPGVEMNETQQMALVQSFLPFYQELPFGAQRTGDLRYGYENTAYSYSDAVFLFCMMRHARPRQLVEVGSGHSSCLMLDTNERWFGGSIKLSFIEPYPELLQSLVRPDDLSKCTLIPTRVQDVPVSTFQRLEANDILFIDSSHVSKAGSDVNRIIFEILPALASGVLIHFHDIFLGFEYPDHWLREGRAWNEMYILRAFLQYNQAFEVVLMNTFLEDRHTSFFESHMPLCLKNRGGSLWLRKK